VVSSSRPLDGRVAVVTGAGRGLGRAHAIELARLGSAVVVNDLGGDESGDGASPAAANHAVDEITRAGGIAVAHHGSVCDPDAVDDLLATALARFGRVDMLVNNAGFLRNAFLLEMPLDAWRSVVDVHLTATFLTLQRFGRHWRERAKAGEHVGPAVVNTTSAAGLEGNVQQANYVAAKAGVAMLTVAAANELGRYGVRVNAVAPLARTRLTMGVPQTAAVMAPAEPSERDPWAPEHVARVVAWLLSPGCRFTGRTFAVHDGVLGMYGGWGLAAVARTDDGWTPDALTAATTTFPDEPDVATQTGLLTDERTIT